jgi:hypothetical protein
MHRRRDDPAERLEPLLVQPVGEGGLLLRDLAEDQQPGVVAEPVAGAAEHQLLVRAGAPLRRFAELVGHDRIPEFGGEWSR